MGIFYEEVMYKPQNSYTGIITNTAEISNDSDENGKDIEDKDSVPNNNNEKEDDIDVEHMKLSYFDLALRKFITAVNSTEITNRVPVFKIDENGNYPEDSINYLVSEKLKKYAQNSAKYN